MEEEEEEEEVLSFDKEMVSILKKHWHWKSFRSFTPDTISSQGTCDSQDDLEMGQFGYHCPKWGKKLWKTGLHSGHSVPLNSLMFSRVF